MDNKLADLQEKISSYKKKYAKPVYVQNNEYSASRICIEIISSVLTGIAVGAIIDYFLNTKLIFLFICLVLSSSAGLYLIYKKTQKR